MLQQTQVATVVGYFERFVEAFPTIEALAGRGGGRGSAIVGKAWATTAVPGNCIGRPRSSWPSTAALFPRDEEAGGRLPGIGRYTAGAILSIAFDARRADPRGQHATALLPAAGLLGRPAVRPRDSVLLWAAAEAALPAVRRWVA